MNTIKQLGVKSIILFLILIIGNINIQAKTYAVVDGQNITDNDVKVLLRNPNVDFATLPKDTQKKVLENLIDAKLLGSLAIKEGITKDKEYIKALKDIKTNLALQVWMKQFIDKLKVSDKKVKTYFKAHKDEFGKLASYKARHILVKTKKEAKDIIKELGKAKDKLAKFIELAKSKSTGPSGSNGGDLGWFDKKTMVPEFSNATAKLKKGSWTKKPVKTQFGYHIIYLEDKKKAQKSKLTSEVKKQIKEKLKRDNFQSELKKITKKLRKKAKITYK